ARHLDQVSRYRFCLSALFCVYAGICSWCVYESEDGTIELLSEFHHAKSLAVAFGFRHAEVALFPIFGLAAARIRFLMTYDHNRIAQKFRRTADDRRIVAVSSVSMNFLKIIEDDAREIERVRSLGVACIANAIHRSEAGVEFFS